MSSLVNKVREALLSDKDETTTTHTTDPRTGTAAHGAGGPEIGFHDASHVTGGNNRGTDGPATTTDGPHTSNLANKADPRVDSNRDHSKNLGANPQGTSTLHKEHPGHSTHGHNTTGLATGAAVGADATHGTHGTHGTHTEANRGFGGPATKTDGPHSSNLLNKADPRVDSDRDHFKSTGVNPRGTATTGNTSSTTHNTTHGTTGTHGTHGTTTGAPEGTYGTHNSRVANAADPRIDSDRDGSRNMGAPHSGPHAGTYTGTHTGTGAHAGTHAGAHTGAHAGTHAGTTGTTGAIGGTHAPGPAPNTAGPHKSDLLNKLDPRVDSNLDGSKTVGGDKTHTQSNAPLAHRDPTDAAQVPPSVLQKHVGEVMVQHDDATHDRERRHSVSRQEQHRGL
ncbi:Uncharacterized protein TPAR_06740 [Tolypocladium paradoxum]|uniref:Period circadian protein n=1 Tax=Tolypocladium paradoxum TaxID=94208 RepID=A0A2S4KS83_9HYPO|nr:Uncharacterized protein TPAR_06740 [Tolypocladium paradoxum]